MAHFMPWSNLVHLVVYIEYSTTVIKVCKKTPATRKVYLPFLFSLLVLTKIEEHQFVFCSNKVWPT